MGSCSDGPDRVGLGYFEMRGQGVLIVIEDGVFCLAVYGCTDGRTIDGYG